ncbi:MAG: ATP-binding cassette domain-containing protein [Puniceicoccales bacterium]|jgi:peptide/nickel transport system ATP-binding protein/oligopeptide transport system ATP-binding protein|nr:ATP-binding cassette domain-containing protein [Puniceicoccales bacterium]
MIEEEHVLSLDSLVVEYRPRRWFPARKSPVKAVNGVSFSLQKGSILGIVGESGGGKSTVLRAICKFIPVKRGHIFIGGVDVTPLSPKQFFPFRKKIQIIPQDFCDTFDPRMSVGKILAEPLAIHFPLLAAREKRARIIDLLESVEMDVSLLDRLPTELSGGQRQRLSIARGLAVNPEVLLCDEIVSGCDLFVQKQILALLTALNREKKIAILFVSHNIAVVAHFCHDIIVMREGIVVESGSSAEICTSPKHTYTRLLIDSVPRVTLLPEKIAV